MADESSPFRRGQRPPGVTDWHLRTPAFRRLFHDVYVDRAAELTPVLLARAALLVVPDATVSHHSAARLWGGIVPDDSLVLSGLPEPVVNHKIRWPDGQVRFRFDLSYPDAGLVVEYDGRQHADSTTQWGSDLGRREWLDGNGWRIVVVIATDLHRTPAATLQRIRAAMRQRGMAVPPVDEQWRRHFTSLPEDLHEPA